MTSWLWLTKDYDLVWTQVRVTEQMSQFIQPLVMNAGMFGSAMHHTAHTLRLEGLLKLHQIEFFQPSSTPFVDVQNVGSRQTWKALAEAPFFQLPPEDLALLNSDPIKCARYTSLVVHGCVWSRVALV